MCSYVLLFSFFQIFCIYITNSWLYTFCKLPNCVTAVKFVRYLSRPFSSIHLYSLIPRLIHRIFFPNTNDIIFIGLKVLLLLNVSTCLTNSLFNYSICFHSIGIPCVRNSETVVISCLFSAFTLLFTLWPNTILWVKRSCSFWFLLIL